MKTIYIAHPFSGDRLDNVKEIDDIMRYLAKNEPANCYISPLHNFSYDEGSPESQILARCFKLISSCDEIWMYGRFEISVGCRAEMAFATFLGIPIIMNKKWG